MDDLHQLVKIENKYLRRRSKELSLNEFSWGDIRAQYRDLRQKIFDEARKHQLLRFQMEHIMQKITNRKSHGESTTKLSTELKKLRRLLVGA